MEWICTKCQAYNKSVWSKVCRQCKTPYGRLEPVHAKEAAPAPKEVRNWEEDHEQTLLALGAIWEVLNRLERRVIDLESDDPEDEEDEEDTEVEPVRRKVHKKKRKWTRKTEAVNPANDQVGP